MQLHHEHCRPNDLAHKNMFLKIISVSVMLITFEVNFARGFNLFKGQPLVLVGEEGCRFGYKVALWDNDQEKRIVVSAPRWRNSFDSTGGAVVNGNIFFCDLSGKCIPHSKLPEFAWPDSATSLLNSANITSPFNVGLGETVYVDRRKASSNILVCAPRYVRSLRTAIQTRGACFLLDSIKVVVRKFVPHTADTYVRGASEYYNDIRSTAYAGAGFSATISQDGQSLFIGSPGAYYGQGLVLEKSYPFDSSQKFKQNKYTYNDDEAFDCSYEAWSMVAGRFGGADEDVVAVSRPRAPNFEGTVNFYSTSLATRDLEKSITNYETGSRFGQELTSGDFDGDGIDDLVVSAPLTAVESTGGRKIKLTDAGTVYIYYSPLRDETVKDPTVLKGREKNGRFGTAINCVGDLDQDGYEDLAVGAPQENFGTVYIFSGSKDGIGTEPSQKLEAVDFAYSGGKFPHGFGFSLAGGVDMDDNGFPDVVIGSVSSDVVVLVKAAPVLRLVGNIYFTKSILYLKPNECRVNPACIELITDVRYISSVFSEPIEIAFNISLDTEESNPRVTFSNNLSIMKTVRHLTNASLPTSFSIFIKDDRPSLERPIRAVATASLTKAIQSRLTSIPPVLSHHENYEFEGSFRLGCNDSATCFSKPDLKLHATMPDVTLKEDHITATVSIRVEEDKAYNVILSVYYPEVLVSSYNTRCEETGRAVAGTSELLCSVSRLLKQGEEIQMPLQFKHNRHRLLQVLEGSKIFLNFTTSSDSRDSNEADNSYSLEVTPGLRINYLLSVSTNMEIARVRLNETMNLTEVIQQEKTETITDWTDFGPEVSYTYAIINNGPSPIFEAEFQIAWPLYILDHHEDEPAPLLYIHREILTEGPIVCNSTEAVNYLNLNISRKDSNQRVKFDSTRKDETNKTSPLGGPNQKRIKRETNSSVSDRQRSRKPYHLSTRRFIEIDCAKSNCYTIRCSVRYLPAKETARATLSSVGIVSTLNKNDYRQAVITPLAHLTVLSPKNATEMKVSSTVEKSIGIILIDADSKLSKFALLKSKWWIFMIAILAGFLVVIAIVAILYKTGFFKRKRAPVISGNARSENYEREQQPEMEDFLDSCERNPACTPTKQSEDDENHTLDRS